MSQPRHVHNKYNRQNINRSKPSTPQSAPNRQYTRNGQKQIRPRRRVLSHTNSQTHKNKKSKASIPKLPRINRMSLSEEIRLATDAGMGGMTSHNIASIVNKGQTPKTSNPINNFLSEFIWEEHPINIIDDTHPHYLSLAAKRKITPCRRKRLGTANTKLTPFKTMSDLKTHRFHLAELFQNDDSTKKDLKDCFEKIPSYYFDGEYEALPSKKERKEREKNESSDSDSSIDEYKIHQKSRIHNLLLRDCKNHKILRTQQKLANYLDIVEVNLLKQICIQSESFFMGLENIQLLQNDVCDILTNIKFLRTNLHRMEQYEVMSWAKTINLSIKQINYNKLLEITENIQNLQILHKNLNRLIAENKYSQSVNVLTQCKIIISKYGDRVKVIKTFEKRLNKIQQTLSIKLVYQICDIAIDINERVLKQKKSKSNTALHISDDSEKCENYIKSCILLQDPSKSVQIIYNTLQTKFNSKISEILCMRNTPHKIGNISVHKSVESYIENITDHSEYIIILQNIYLMSESVLLSMQSICDSFHTYLTKGVFKDYAHINSTSIEAYQSSSDSYCASLCAEILSLCSQLLQNREHRNSAMSLYELKSVFAKTLSFLQNVESITNTTCYDIRGVLLKQAQSFLDKFHKVRINKLNQSLESDKWSSVKVPMNVQIEVSQLQSGEKKQTHNGEMHNNNNKNRAEKEAILIHIDDKQILSKTSMSKLESSFELCEYDDVDDLRFKSVASLLCLMSLVYEYIECAGKLPPIAYDVENKLIELFTLFNSKTCQLVLGAGAMQTVQLRAITAKHLALAQQSISVLIVLLPQIHSQWFVKIIPRNCLPLVCAQISRLNEDLEQHSNEIFKKLIAIMEQLINFKFDGSDQYQSSLLNESKPNRVSAALTHKVHPSISSLMTECKKMHRLMMTYMQSYQIQIIFQPIVLQFEMKLNSLITKVQKLHLDKSESVSVIIPSAEDHKNEESTPESVTIKHKPQKRDMTQAFHSLNMSIKFISDKLNRLNCDAQHLANLCIEID